MKAALLTLTIAATAWLATGCSLTEKDVERAVTVAAQMNAANLADKACGIPTFGLEDVSVTKLVIDEHGSGSATVGGIAKGGPGKGQSCSGAVTFQYGRARTVIRGSNGREARVVAVVTSADPAH